MSTTIVQNSTDSNKQLNSSKGVTKSFLNVYASVETIINGFVSLVVNIFMFAITTLTPLAAPIAPAFSVYKALSERLETPFAIALAGAIAIEITGMFVAKTSIAAHNWNSARNKTDPEAPKGLAITMAAIFFSVIFILSLTIELNPNLVIWIYPGFVIVAITVYVCLAISNNLKDWEQRKAQDLESRELKNGINAEIREAQKKFKNLAQNLADIDTQIDTRQNEFDTLIEEKQNELSIGNENIKILAQKLNELDIQIETRQNELSVTDENIKTLAQRLKELDTQFDTRQQEFDSLLAQIEAKQNELSATKNELSKVSKLVSNGDELVSKSPLNGVTIETANNAKLTKIELRRKAVLSLLEQEMSQADIANELEVSIATVKRDIKFLNGSVK